MESGELKRLNVPLALLFVHFILDDKNTSDKQDENYTNEAKPIRKTTKNIYPV